MVESAFELDEGKQFRWSGGYTGRLDNRPSEQGGPQLHIRGPQGQKWAYRFDGSRSEPHKYTLRTTNRVRDFVSQAFGIPTDQVHEMLITSANSRKILIEVGFR